MCILDITIKIMDALRIKSTPFLTTSEADELCDAQACDLSDITKKRYRNKQCRCWVFRMSAVSP